MPTYRSLTARRDELVPVLARRDAEHDPPQAAVVASRTRSRDLDAAGGDPHDGAVEALVGDHQVAAPAEHEQRLAGGVGVADRGDHVGLGVDLHQSAGRPAEAQRGEVGERDVVVTGTMHQLRGVRREAAGRGPGRASTLSPPVVR